MAQPSVMAEPHHYGEHDRKGFFTDTSICIGCKACEVACKEWNGVPQDNELELLGSSYDNTGDLGANTWRHVAFVEQGREQIAEAKESGRKLVDLGMPSIGPPTGTNTSHGSPDGALSATDAVLDGYSDVDTAPPDTPEFRWLMSSDVCKHCTDAPCLDACPTGALFRTENGAVVVQDDVCNGCGTCVTACPFGVIERRDDGVIDPKTDRKDSEHASGHTEDLPNKGTANKCTLCYDRLAEGDQPACATACPTTSIKFGNRDELVEEANERVRHLHEKGMTEARLYGANPKDGVRGTGSIFLLLDEPEVYGLPPDPRACTADLPDMFKKAGLAAVGMLAAAGLAALGGRR